MFEIASKRGEQSPVILSQEEKGEGRPTGPRNKAERKAIIYHQMQEREGCRQIHRSGEERGEEKNCHWR